MEYCGATKISIDHIDRMGNNRIGPDRTGSELEMHRIGPDRTESDRIGVGNAPDRTGSINVNRLYCMRTLALSKNKKNIKMSN